MSGSAQIFLDLNEQRLWIDGEPVQLQSRIFNLLRLFIERRGQLLTKSTILRKVWSDVHVSEASVKDCVKNLRAVLGDDASTPIFIETVRGRGYRYLGGIGILDGSQRGQTPLEPVAIASRPAGRAAPQQVAKWTFLTLSVAALIAGASILYATLGAPSGVAPARDEELALRLADRPSIAVLPFQNLSVGTDAELIATGLTHDLRTALGRFPQLFVSAATASFEPDAERLRYGKVAEQLGVRYLLTGNARTENGRLRVSAQLVDALSGEIAWSERYERDATHLFSAMDEIVLSVLKELRLHWEVGEMARTVADTENLDSWLASVAAYNEFLKFAPDANRKARQLWREALRHDPDRFIPHAGIAFTHYYDAWRGWSPDRETSIRNGLRHAKTAIARAPDQAIGYQALGSLTILQGNHAGGLQLRRKAVELGPNDFSAIGGLASFLCALGKPGKRSSCLARPYA